MIVQTESHHRGALAAHHVVIAGSPSSWSFTPPSDYSDPQVKLRKHCKQCFCFSDKWHLSEAESHYTLTIKMNEAMRGGWMDGIEEEEEQV